MKLSSLFGRSRPEPARFSVRSYESRPDIISILTDEQRHDDVGFRSGGYYETPVLDDLARQGVAFEQAYSGSTVCVPARASLLTGLPHHRVPLQSGTLALREGYFTIARALRTVGYETALVGKMHFFPMYANHGFDRMELAENLIPFSGYHPGEIDDYHRWLIWQGRADHSSTHMFGPGHEADAAEHGRYYSAIKFPYEKSFHPINWIANRATEILRSRNHGKPLFLIVSFPRPHAPYDPAEPYASLYDPSDARLPKDGFEVNEGLPPAFLDAFGRAGRQRHIPQPVTAIPEDVYRRVLTYVRALVRQIDDAMGEILANVDRPRSVVFFTADHGTYGGHRGLIGKVPWIAFDNLARVPFVVAAPGAAAGTRVTAPMQSYDFALTCLDYAGITPPNGVFDTVSLRPFIEGAPAPQDRAVFTGGSVGWPMVRRRQLKLMRHGPDATEVLFDLERDPGETENRATDGAYTKQMSELCTLLDATLRAPVPELELPQEAEPRQARVK